jgi:hypothetical protein
MENAEGIRTCPTGIKKGEEGIVENALCRLVILPTRHHRIIGPIYEGSEVY